MEEMTKVNIVSSILNCMEGRNVQTYLKKSKDAPLPRVIGIELKSCHLNPSGEQNPELPLRLH